MTQEVEVLPIGEILQRVMRHCIAVAMISLQGFVHAAGVATEVRGGELLTSPGCDFNVRFPVRAERKRDMGSQGLMVNNSSDTSAPFFLEATCKPIFDPQQATAGLRELMMSYTKAVGLKQPYIAIEQGEVGAIGVFSGSGRLPGANVDAQVAGKMLVGPGSLIALVAMAPAGRAMPAEIHRFLGSVEVKNRVKAIPSLEVQQAERLSRVVGVLVGKRTTLEASLEHCQSRIPELKTRIQSAKVQWTAYNIPVLDRFSRVLESVMKEFYGERLYGKEMQALPVVVDESRSKLLRTMGSKPIEQLKCDEFVEFVMSGAANFDVAEKEAFDLANQTLLEMGR